MEDFLIEFQIYLYNKNLINNHDWDFGKEAKKFIKNTVVKLKKCECKQGTFTRFLNADFNRLCDKCGHLI